MDNQEKIKWLKQYRLNELEIIRLKEELQWWRSQSERVTSGKGGMGGGSGAHDDRLQCAVDGITTLQSQLSEQLLTRVQLRSDIAAAIGSIPDERLRQLMRYRYIDGWTWERIVALFFDKKSNYSDKYESHLRTIFRWHSEGLNCINVIECQ